MSEQMIKVSRHPRTMSFTLGFIALVQLVLGVGFLVAPASMASLLGLAVTPDWANWMFGMMAARFLGFGYGMLIAARQVAGNVAWLRAMVGIQLIDWVVTMKYLVSGTVTLAQVNTASFLPLVFVALLWWGWPRAPRAA
jgi:hypothetical protein